MALTINLLCFWKDPTDHSPIIEEMDPSQRDEKSKKTEGNRILMYITTHLTENHSKYLEQCWPTLLAKSPLFKMSDFMMFVTESEDGNLNMTLIQSVFADAGVTVHVRPNPGYQQGAILAMTEAFDNHWFDGYEWIIRLNPDVLIRNDTWLLNRLNDESTNGIFADCSDVECLAGNRCEGRRIHTDFLALRPDAVPTNAFDAALKKSTERRENAENITTEAFSSIVMNGKDSWLSGTGPHSGKCRVRGDSSPVIHTHTFHHVYPACLSWYP